MLEFVLHVLFFVCFSVVFCGWFFGGVLFVFCFIWVFCWLVSFLNYMFIKKMYSCIIVCCNLFSFVYININIVICKRLRSDIFFNGIDKTKKQTKHIWPSYQIIYIYFTKSIKQHN